MRASTVTSFGLVILLGSVLAIPSKLTPPTAIIKRQIGGGDDSNANLTRPAEWDDLPRLPPILEQAYERNAEITALALLRLELVENVDVNVDVMSRVLEGLMTYFAPGRAREIVTHAARQIRDSESAGVSKDTALLEKTRSLDLPTLEREMAGFVRFRSDHEAIGSPGQEAWRNPLLREEGQPIGMASPYHSLTENHDRQLIIAKALSGRFSQSALLDYLLSQDPFLAGFERNAATLVEDTLRLYRF